MKIGIMGAMIEEITPLLDIFKSRNKIITSEKIANNTYHKILLDNDELIIAYSKIGKVYSTICACVMLEHYRCEKIIFSGVAGGLSRDLKVGDLLIASKLVQHDVDITAFGHALGFIPESKLFIEANTQLNIIAKHVAKRLDLHLHEGIIASGDQFIYDMSKKNWLVKQFGAMATEMEGASVAVVCDTYKVPFCIFRSISDSADDKAIGSFDEFLTHAAKKSAKFCVEMLKELGLKF